MDILNSKYGHIWRLLTEYQFEIISIFDNNLHCIICKKILRNAHQNICGCKYCYDCIQRHVNCGGKYCPGETEDCKEEILNLEQVQIDYHANVKISKLTVRCPIGLCAFKSELNCIDEHIETHKYMKSSLENDGNISLELPMEIDAQTVFLINSIKQIEFDIGAEKECTVKREASFTDLEHKIASFANEHTACLCPTVVDSTSLLLDASEALKMRAMAIVSDLDGNQDLLTKFESIIEELKSRLTDKTKRFSRRISATELTKRRIELTKDTLNHQMQHMLFQNKLYHSDYAKLLKTDIDRLIRSRTEGTVDNYPSIMDTLSSIRREMPPNDDRCYGDDVVGEKVRKTYDEEFHENSTKRRKLDTNKFICCGDEQSDTIRSEGTAVTTDIARPISAPGSEDLAPFRWTIKHFSRRLQIARRDEVKACFSEPFYSHRDGYKIRLQAYPNGRGEGKGTHLSVFFFLLRGQHDDELEWPMKWRVSIGLVDQSTGDIVISSDFCYGAVGTRDRYGLHRPVYDTNRAIGEAQFFDLQALMYNDNVLHDDSLVLLCSVDRL